VLVVVQRDKDAAIVVGDHPHARGLGLVEGRAGLNNVAAAVLRDLNFRGGCRLGHENH
jgi:hypothetical protein